MIYSFYIKIKCLIGGVEYKFLFASLKSAVILHKVAQSIPIKVFIISLKKELWNHPGQILCSLILRATII